VLIALAVSGCIRDPAGPVSGVEFTSADRRRGRVRPSSRILHVQAGRRGGAVLEPWSSYGVRGSHVRAAATSAATGQRHAADQRFVVPPAGFEPATHGL